VAFIASQTKKIVTQWVQAKLDKKLVASLSKLPINYYILHVL